MSDPERFDGTVLFLLAKDSMARLSAKVALNSLQPEPVSTGPSKAFGWLCTGGAVVGFAVLAWQSHRISELHREVDSLRLGQQGLATTLSELPTTAFAPEIDRVQNQTAELFRLRDELDRLRAEVRRGTVGSQIPTTTPPAPEPALIPSSISINETRRNALTLKGLAERLAGGDQNAFAELRSTANEMYRGIDYEKERERVVSNLRVMRAAFDLLGEQAGHGNAQAIQALKLSLGAEHLRAFAPSALGTAAAAGNTEALEMLVNYPAWGILTSSAVSALRAPAEANLDPAMNILVGILQDPHHRPLWQEASQGLVGAAVRGNQAAKSALEAYGSVARPAQR